MHISHWKISPSTPETYDCTEIGTFRGSLGCSVGQLCSRGISRSDYTINILVRLHLRVAVHQKSVEDISHVCSKQWRHIGPELNPADEISRGLIVEEMCANSKWLNAPHFLTKKDEFWPRDPTLHEPELSDDDPEIKRAQYNSQSSSSHQSEDVLSSVIERHSSRERLNRAVAWLPRFRTWFIEDCCRKTK